MGYFERALLASIVIGAGAGFVGALVVLRRRTFFAQALTHGTYPGADEQPLAADQAQPIEAGAGVGQFIYADRSPSYAIILRFSDPHAVARPVFPHIRHQSPIIAPQH